MKPQASSPASKPAAEKPIVAGAGDVPAAVRELARRCYLTSVVKNQADREGKTARKDLFAILEESGVSGFELGIKDADGRPVRLAVSVETPEKEYIDVATLRGLVTEEQFMAIVSATKKEVEEHAGKAIAVRATMVKQGERNVFVKTAG